MEQFNAVIAKTFGLDSVRIVGATTDLEIDEFESIADAMVMARSCGGGNLCLTAAYPTGVDTDDAEF